MFETDLLLLWLPARRVAGTLEAEVSKHGLTGLPGTVEPEARDYYRNRGGLLLSVVGWQGEWGAAGVELPPPVHALLDGLVGAHPEGFEAVVWNDAPRLDEVVIARRDELHGRWVPGVRHQVFP